MLVSFEAHAVTEADMETLSPGHPMNVSERSRNPGTKRDVRLKSNEKVVKICDSTMDCNAGQFCHRPSIGEGVCIDRR